MSAPANDTTEAPLYKVLVDGASCHGGTMRWSLPTRSEDGTWTPGAWVEVTGALVHCSNGPHLTREPSRWWMNGSTLYVAEYEGEIVEDGSDKVAVRRARLIREADWSEGQVYREGQHTVSRGMARASDSATVWAFGSATVRAYDSATVISDRWHSNSAQVALSQLAAHVDRRGDTLVLRSATVEATS